MNNKKFIFNIFLLLLGLVLPGRLNADSVHSDEINKTSLFPAAKGRSRILLSQKWSKGDEGVGKFDLLDKNDYAYDFVIEGPVKIIEGNDSNGLLILDSALCRVKNYIFKSNSAKIISWAPGHTGSSPNFIDMVQGKRNEVFILDKASGNILVYSSDGSFLRAFGDFPDPLWLGIDDFNRLYVKDNSLFQILVFNSEGQWLAGIKTDLYNEKVRSDGTIIGLYKASPPKKEIQKDFFEYHLKSFEIFNKEKSSLLHEAKVKKLAFIKGFYSKYSLLGVQFIGIDKLDRLYLAVTEGISGKPLILSLVRYDKMGRIESRMEIDPVLNFSMDVSMFSVRNSGEILVMDPNEHNFIVKGYTLF
jgi:hypothetical protein